MWRRRRAATIDLTCESQQRVYLSRDEMVLGTNRTVSWLIGNFGTFVYYWSMFIPRRPQEKREKKTSVFHPQSEGKTNKSLGIVVQNIKSKPGNHNRAYLRTPQRLACESTEHRLVAHTSSLSNIFILHLFPQLSTSRERPRASP
jgi:hypothetical protein